MKKLFNTLLFILTFTWVSAQTCPDILNNMSGHLYECNGDTITLCQGPQIFILQLQFTGVQKNVWWDISIQDTNGVYPSTTNPSVIGGNSIITPVNGQPHITSVSTGQSSHVSTYRCDTSLINYSNSILTGFSIDLTTPNIPICVNYLIRITDHPSQGTSRDSSIRTCFFQKCYDPCFPLWYDPGSQDSIPAVTPVIDTIYIPFNMLGQDAEPMKYRRKKDGTMVRIIQVE